MKTYRLKCFIVDGQVKYVQQKRWLLFFWLTPYLRGNFVDGFYDAMRLFGGEDYSWYETSGVKVEPENGKVVAYYD